ncbi:MAG: XdhC family protein [Cyanobacteria bacterium P01_D01_bin.115]
MNHNLQAILNAYQNRNENPTFLATVVCTQGSTYRRPGARMLMTDQGKMTGMVSGGCLDHDIICHIQQQAPPHDPFLITYDTTVEEDLLWGFGLGCNGAVQVLVECLESVSVCHPLTFIQSCFERQQPGVLATVFRVEGNRQIPIGGRLTLHTDGSIDDTLVNAELRQAIAEDARIVLSQAETIHRHYPLSVGQVDVLFEFIQLPTQLILFGAGRDAVPLAKFAKTLGWYLTIVDCRALETTRERFAISDQIILTHRDAVSQQVAIAQNTVAVVMTHNYHDDVEILKMLLQSSANYIGVLGSRQRSERLLKTLRQETSVDMAENRLYAPIGLDIGAETPEEIAISIVAEIQAVLTHHKAGFLRYRQTPIHQLASQSQKFTYATL